MKKAVLLIPLVLAAITSVNAQSVGPSTLNATGGSKVIGTQEFEWSVGEMTMVSTFTGSSVIVTQGVLQPSAAMTGVQNTTGLINQLQVFPNPASSVVNFRYTSVLEGRLNYRLIDMTGKVISSQTMNVKQGTNEQQLDLTSLACATYFLEITAPGSETISYKIQKIK
jgi:hypothetical protein